MNIAEVLEQRFGKLGRKRLVLSTLPVTSRGMTVPSFFYGSFFEN